MAYGCFVKMAFHYRRLIKVKHINTKVKKYSFCRFCIKRQQGEKREIHEKEVLF